METYEQSSSYLLADNDTTQGVMVHRRRLWRTVHKLMCLGCPYLQDLDETVVKEIVFSDGEARIRTIQWLVGRFHPRLQEILFTSGTSMTTVATLTSILADLGLCSREDYELVKGSTAVSRQLPFLEALLDLVGISGSDDLNNSAECTPHEKLSQKAASCCSFMDNLLRQEDLSVVFPRSLSLIPPGISKATAMESTLDGCGLRDGSSSTSKTLKESSRKSNDVPTCNELAKQLEVLMTTLKNSQTELDQLTQSHCHEPLNMPALDNTQKSLLVSLDTLSQLATNFCHTYETEIQPWTNRQTPTFTSLGPHCKRVDTHRGQVEKLLKSIDLLQASLLAVIRIRDEQSSHTRSSKLCQSAQQSFHGCLQVLKTWEQ